MPVFDVAFVADGVVIAEEFVQAGLLHGLRVMGVAGQWVRDVHQVPERSQTN